MRKIQFLILIAFSFATFQSFCQNQNKLVKYDVNGTTYTPSNLVELTTKRLGYPSVTDNTTSYFEIRKSTNSGALLRLNGHTAATTTNYIDFMDGVYGIYQSSSTIKNYFSGKVGIGALPSSTPTIDLNVGGGIIAGGGIYCSGITSSGNVSSISDYLRFTVTSQSSSKIKFELFDQYSRFYNKIIPDAFQLTENSANGKVLVSDEVGNARWAYPKDLGELNYWTKNESNDIYSNARYVGIGTQHPSRELDVIGDIALTGAIYGKPSDKAWNKLQLYGSSNTNAGYIEIGDGNAGWNCIKLVAPGENGYLQLWADRTVSMLIREADIIIGGVDNQVDLKVNGKIFTKEVKVSLTDWSDFVFADNYQLMPLKDVDSFIKLNKHLPAIPSEKEVLESGVNVGEMNALLLQKIEELTLYIIKQQKQLDSLEEKISQMPIIISK